MEPLLLIGIPGLLGGALLALVLLRVKPRAAAGPPRRLAPPSPSLINMAHIRIDGIGGLGMVAVSLTVAALVPSIRTAISVALLLGIVFAMILIARRRRTGPLPSSSQHAGAHSMFLNDPPPAPVSPR